MATTTDHPKHYKSWGNTTAVVVHMRRAGEDIYVEVATAKKRILPSDHRSFAGVALRGSEVVWSIPVDLMGGHTLLPRDRIIEGTLAAVQNLNEENRDQIAWNAITVLGNARRFRALCSQERYASG